MKKSILNLGKTLNKKEQKKITGGKKPIDCSFSADTSTDWCCFFSCE